MHIMAATLQILGGLALFMYSISLLSDTMKRVASLRMKSILEKATTSPLRGLLAGTIVTFLVQSSSVTVLLLLGLVNAGIMKLRQAIYVILGSEIGTTITAQIVAFKVTMFFFPLIVAGFVLRTVFADKEKIRNCGEVLFCLGLLFLAMKIMADGARPFKELPLLMEAISQFGTFPLLGMLIGTLFTAITSSSSATTSLIIAMSMEGVVDLPSGIALLIGANIGTCVLELIAMIGTNVAAKRTGLAQFLINLLGALMIYPLLSPFTDFISHTADDLPRQLANAHTFFNVALAFILLPFAGALIFVLGKIIRDKDEEVPETASALDEKMLNIPALALYRAEEEVKKMAALTQEMLKMAKIAFFTGDREAGKTVHRYEKTIDQMNSQLNSYLGRINTLLLSQRDGNTKKALIHSLTDIERVADLAENLADYADQKEVIFSKTARGELEKIFSKATAEFNAAVQTIRMRQKSLIIDVTAMESQLDALEIEYRRNYFNRLENVGGGGRLDAFYPAVLKDLERIGDHSYNIAEYFSKL